MLELHLLINDVGIISLVVDLGKLGEHFNVFGHPTFAVHKQLDVSHANDFRTISTS